MVRFTGASTRNRARLITNKYKLTVVHGDLESDPEYIPDEDDEKEHLTSLVAGVDAEDANEHHLQAVLTGPSRGAEDKDAPPAAFIPTPDSTGIVDNYADLYLPNRWKDPITYLHSSITPEESCKAAITAGFTYYMDERDKAWLDKNNGEARGEGTSSQGARSTSIPRTSVRSTKAKGKEPESSCLLTISDNEFELVMGLFEKITHEKTEYLHHGLETGMAFPAFSEYHDPFSCLLPPSTFASYSVPTWIPPPAQLVQIARAIYPHWKERRTERGGHRIIHTLNYDESDVLNESYVCFRRREIKTIRKTRASQATSSDKLLRLQFELAYPLQLGKLILQREQLKKDSAQHTRHVWDKRLLFADFKKKWPSWSHTSDEELLVDQERPKNTEASRPSKSRSEVSGATVHPDIVIAMRPTELTAHIKEIVEAKVNQQKELDQHWEDHVDDPYQSLSVPHASRYFQYIPLNTLPPPSNGRLGSKGKWSARAVRTRHGRGGRFIVDRRDYIPPHNAPTGRPPLFKSRHEDDGMKHDNFDGDDMSRMLKERWRYDIDDIPAFGPDGWEETNRILVDDYLPKFLRHSMSLLLEPDHQNLVTDPTIPIIKDGRPQLVIPFKLGQPLPPLRRGPLSVPRAGIPQGYQRVSSTLPLPPNVTPIATQQQLKNMPPPTVVPHMRISSNGGMRPSPLALGMQSPVSMPHSPPDSAALSHHPPLAGNGIHRPAINLPHIDSSEVDMNGTQQSSLAGVIRLPQTRQPDTSQLHDLKISGAVLTSNKPQNLASSNGVNGFHFGPRAASTVLANSIPFTHQPIHGLSQQQVLNIKTTFANAIPTQDFNTVKAHPRVLPAHLQTAVNHSLQLSATPSFNLKLPASRQWAPGTPPPTRINPINSGVDAVGLNGPNPHIPVQAIPLRTQSANGMGPTMHMVTNSQFVGLSPHVHHSPQTTSPPRITPSLPKASPLLQHQQPSGSSKSGY